MKLRFVVGTMLVAVAATISAKAQTDRAPVTLQLVGDDGLSVKLHDALKYGLERDDLLRPAAPQDQSAIIIESDRNVRWDELDGRTVVIATVYVFRSPSDRGGPIVQVCWENQMKACARDILRIARKQID